MTTGYHLVCPSCATVNRVPRERPPAAAKCGKCGQPLFQGQPIDLTAASFDRHLREDGVPLLVDFWATWCGPCRMEIPHFIEMQKLYGEKGLQIVGVSLDQGGKDDVAPFAKNKGINYDMLLGTNEAAMAYGGVKGIPTTFVITQDGKIYKKYVGVRPRETFESDVKALLGISS